MITTFATSVYLGVITPTPNPTLDENSVTPGVWGFIAIFLVAAATVALIFDMNRRVRRTRYRGEVRAQLEAERAAADVQPGDRTD